MAKKGLQNLLCDMPITFKSGIINGILHFKCEIEHYVEQLQTSENNSRKMEHKKFLLMK